MSFDDSDEQEQEAEGGVKQLRDHAEQLKKELKALRKEYEPLKAFKEEQDAKSRESTVLEAFKAKGFRERDGRMFLRLNPEAEPTDEIVAGFATEWELVSEETKETGKPDATYIPSVGAVASNEKAKIPRSELDQMLGSADASTVQEGMKILREGRWIPNNPQVTLQR